IFCAFSKTVLGDFFGVETLLRLKRFGSENALGKLQIQQRKGLGKLEGAGVETQRREDSILDHILGKTAETLGGGLDWIGNKIDGAIDSIVGAASSAWDGVKNGLSNAWEGTKSALGFEKGVVASVGERNQQNMPGKNSQVSQQATITDRSPD
ncbi:hypothetical protein LEP1GSC021_2570, partial [Leptospira noguchii str. 1993005606]